MDFKLAKIIEIKINTNKEILIKTDFLNYFIYYMNSSLCVKIPNINDKVLVYATNQGFDIKTCFAIPFSKSNINNLIIGQGEVGIDNNVIQFLNNEVNFKTNKINANGVQSIILDENGDYFLNKKAIIKDGEGRPCTIEDAGQNKTKG